MPTTQKGISKFLEHLKSESMFKLGGIPFVWQLYSKEEGLPLSEIYGKLETVEGIDYVFKRALTLRDLTPNNIFISIRFILNKILLGFSTSIDFKEILKLMNELDELQKSLILETETNMASSFYTINYINKVLDSLPDVKINNFKRIMYDVNAIDKECPNVKEIFLGNKECMSFLGLIHKNSHNEPWSIIVNGLNLTFLIGAVRSSKLASTMLYIAQENHVIIEDFLKT